MTATQQEINYIAGRKKYTRPQGIAFAEAYNQSTSGLIPAGFEVNSAQADNLETFLILSDHNRGAIDISPKRIETRERMVNGRMRSYHIDDKKMIRLSWDNLPSRSYATSPEFAIADSFSGQTQTAFTGKSSFYKDRAEYTVDGGAGGADIKEWYDQHVGSFYVLLAYDNSASLQSTDGPNGSKYAKLGQYTEAIEMFISDFSFNVNKRGATTHDLWSVSISLEEA
jgi:hypothetical protein